MLNFLVSLVGATGIEPVTPTVSRLAPASVRRWPDWVNFGGLRDLPGFCRECRA